MKSFQHLFWAIGYAITFLSNTLRIKWINHVCIYIYIVRCFPTTAPTGPARRSSDLVLARVLGRLWWFSGIQPSFCWKPRLKGSNGRVPVWGASSKNVSFGNRCKKIVQKTLEFQTFCAWRNFCSKEYVWNMLKKQNSIWWLVQTRSWQERMAI